MSHLEFCCSTEWNFLNFYFMVEQRHVFSGNEKICIVKPCYYLFSLQQNSRLIAVIFPLTALQEIWADIVDENLRGYIKKHSAVRVNKEKKINWQKWTICFKK